MKQTNILQGSTPLSPYMVRVHSSHQGSSRRGTKRLDVALVEDHAVRGQGVDVGCDDVTVSEADIVVSCQSIMLRYISSKKIMLNNIPFDKQVKTKNKYHVLSQWSIL